MKTTKLLVQNPWVHHGRQTREEVRTIVDRKSNAGVDKGFKR